MELDDLKESKIYTIKVLHAVEFVKCLKAHDVELKDHNRIADIDNLYPAYELRLPDEKRPLIDCCKKSKSIEVLSIAAPSVGVWIKYLNDQIDKFEVVESEDPEFRVYINNKKLTFTASGFNSLERWKDKLLNVDIILEDMGVKAKRAFVNFQKDLMLKKEIVWIEELSVNELIGHMLMDEIYKLVKVNDDEAFITNPSSALICPKLNGRDVIEVKTNTIQSIVNRKQKGANIQLIRSVLNPFMVENTRKRRLNGKLTPIWKFYVDDEIDSSTSNPHQ
uniref:Uncharacterized protein n=1 Tax=viral metagenome TaxID=1070528 RepID=A0A6M3LYS3_9ZZZZ